MCVCVCMCVYVQYARVCVYMLHSRKPLIVAYSVFFDRAEILEIPKIREIPPRYRCCILGVF